MVENQAGVTALVTAYIRAYHAVNSQDKIFNDYLADRLFSAEEHVSFNQNLTGMLPLINPELAALNPTPKQAMDNLVETHHGPITLSRSAYTEACLEQAIQRGVSQYVILGAGLDTYAFRHNQKTSPLQVFEIDHPATQALKRQRVAAAGWDIPPQLVLIPIDFTRQSLSDVLRASTFQPERPAFFSWLGVSYYLAPDVVAATLREVRSLAAPGSELVFDYMDAEAFIPEKAGKKIQLMHWIASRVGEPMKAGFEPGVLAALLNDLAYAVLENLPPSEIETRFFSGRSDAFHAFDHVHFMRAVVR
ncbi:MAG: class I SAM-dependent methyltransferase [Anaerolineae bacterium]|nr:class I SAM-dependent methyltransferase [Anaerolineae bacterium]